MNPPQNKYIQVERIKTRYWAEGEGEAAAVFIHGIGGSIEPWLSSFTSLASRQPVYAMDLMGHGLTDKPMDISYNVREFATFIKNFMAALTIKHAHIVGHSMGGAIALRFTLMFPEMVDKLVLVSSAGLGKAVSPVLRICAIPFLGESLTRPSLSGTETSLKTLVYDPAVITKESINLNYKMASLPGAQKAFLRILRTNFSPLFGQIGTTSMAELGTIKNPVLVIWGKQDHTIPIAHSDAAVKYLPDVHAHIFDHCGHLPMLEHEQEFNGLLSDFLSF
jgi:4,5:9,10-diseco-3-hydroxy-5,9,17-trioxoandrosta-1(10),2-diene-4-oate hydrolase